MPVRHTAWIGLGSNLGQPERQLRAATWALAALPGSELGAVSPVYRSRAIGPGQQPDYLNAVAALETALAPLALLDALQDIEQRQGRVRTVRWGPRTLDLDILLYHDRTLDQPRLQVPHPRLAERAFVLYPLQDIAGPNLLLPDGAELGKLVSACPGDGLERTTLRLSCDGE
jgi:2-amino-4-hydroxy-6-hydroxymethyldihydropteridine diphosphokinase